MAYHSRLCTRLSVSVNFLVGPSKSEVAWKYVLVTVGNKLRRINMYAKIVDNVVKFPPKYSI